MKASSAKNKGRNLENQIRDDLRTQGIDRDAYRVAGSGAGLDKGDVYSPNTSWVFEAKNHKRSSPLDWMKQMEAEAKTKLGGHGAVVWSPPRTHFDDSIVMLRWYEFRELLRAGAEPKGLEHLDQKAKYDLERAAYHLKRLSKYIDL